MKIAVLVKIVADPLAKEIKISEGGSDFESSTAINPLDYHALEQALVVKEQLRGQEAVEIFSLTLGPEKFMAKAKEPLNLGLDRAIWIKDKVVTRDKLRTAVILSMILSQEKPDLIFGGARSIEQGSGLVPILIAELMGMPFVLGIKSFRIDLGKKIVRATNFYKNTENTLQADLPALFSCERGLNTPRTSGTIQTILAAKKKSPTVLNTSELNMGLVFPARTEYSYPPQRSAGRIIKDGSLENSAAEFLKLLKAVQEEV